MKKSILMLAVCFSMSLAFTSCRDTQKNDDDTVESVSDDVGDDIEDAADDTGDAIENAADDTGDAIENGADEIEENTDDNM